MAVLAVDGADIYYEVHGNGPPMLLLSGTACDGVFWTPHQVPEFSRDHAVIILDQRGMGKTVTRSADYATTRLPQTLPRSSSTLVSVRRSLSVIQWAGALRSSLHWIIRQR